MKQKSPKVPKAQVLLKNGYVDSNSTFLSTDVKKYSLNDWKLVPHLSFCYTTESWKITKYSKTIEMRDHYTFEQININCKCALNFKYSLEVIKLTE